MNVLIFAFEPLSSGKKNAGYTTAEWVMEGLTSEVSGLVNVQLITVSPFFACKETLIRSMEEHKPDLVIGLQVSPGNPWVLVEQCALNIIHTHHYPNWEDQEQYMTPIYQNGASALFTRTDTIQLIEIFREHGVPAEHSFHCGTGIANYSYYMALQEMDSEQALFIHVPQSPEQAIMNGVPVPVFPPWQTAQGLTRWIIRQHEERDTKTS